MKLEENMVVAGRFRLVRMIGRGGMGSVWQAVHQGLDTPCAVKFIEGELANVAEAHARFEREAKAAAQLRSPHVVQIFDHGVWEGHPYIAMELLDGEDLGKRLARNAGKLPAPAVNIIVEQVCRALSKAHQAGIVHRDLKPDNIFIVNDDDREIVKILDFGVAKSTSQTIDGSNTKTGAMLGTPYYMSPEQAQGIKSVDSRSDLWSLAVIVFQCLTGRLPFESEALGDLLVKIIVSPIPTPSTYEPNVPPGFDRWWGRASDRNPEARFATAKDFALELAVALGLSAPGLDAGRIMGGTAMMSSPDLTSQVPNTPFPGAHTAALGTPNPAAAPSGAGLGSNPAIAVASTQGSHPGLAASSPGHGATFSGVEPPIGVPKKSAPVALFALFGVLLLTGLGLGGAALYGQSKAGSAASADPTASTTPPPPDVTPSATSVAADRPDDPKPETTAAVADAAKASEGAEDPAKGAGSAAPVATVAPATAAAKPPVGGHKPVGKPPPTKPVASSAAAATPTATGQKPINLGF